jgi:hypothetical protein
MAAYSKQTGTGQMPGYIYTRDPQAFGNSDVVVGQPSSLISLLISNKAASGTLYFQLFDATAVPSNTAVPFVAPIVLAAASTVRIALNEVGKYFDGIAFSNGIVWAVSTTAATLTIDSTSSVWATCRYIT